MRVTNVVRELLTILGCGLFAVLLTHPAQADQSITLRSGNGPALSATNPTPRDAQVRFHAFGAYGNITPTASDFAAAQAGSFAYINAPYATYVKQLPSDPLAQWIGTSSSFAGGSTLYAIPFTVTDSVIGTASLNLGYAVDNEINGIYINGQPISNNILDGDYHGEYYVLRSDIAPLLKPNSVNWLYLNAADYGSLAGIIYTANISIQGAAPGAATVTPSTGGNTGNVSVQITGSGFQPGAQIALSGAGSTINATNVTVVSPTVVTGTFNLNGAAIGPRTVTVSNPNKTSVTLSNAFTVVAGGASPLTIQKIGTPAVTGRNQTFFITITNTGTIDSGAQSVTELVQPWFTPVSYSQQPDSIDSISFGGNDYPTFLEWTVPALRPGGSTTLSYTVALAGNVPAGNQVQGPACAEDFQSGVNAVCKSVFTGCMATIATKGCGLIFDIGPWGLATCSASILYCTSTWVACKEGGAVLCSAATSAVRGSIDPNDITGPAGFGTQGWFNPKPPFQYALSFSNKPTATNPAVNVYLTDTFDADQFDLGTLAIAGLSTSSTNYAPAAVPLATAPFTHDIDLRPAQPFLLRVNAALDPVTHQVSISLLTLDPNTGLEPADPTQGFLPAGAGGTVLFTIQPKASLTTGTVFQDSASVVFDTNAPIATPVWTNTVDIDPPASQVAALPATETTASFNVSWSGKDAASGIGSYTIYASDNGAPFAVWLANTTATSSSYPGVDGHSYSFYSIATDNAGNAEAAKTIAEASTTVSVPPAAIATSVNFTYSPAGPFKVGEKMTLRAQVIPASGTAIPSGTLTYTSAYGNVTVPLDATGTAILPVQLDLAPGSYTLTANYNGTSQFLKSQSAPVTGIVTAQ